MGGGQDNPVGLYSSPGSKINQPGYVAPRSEDFQGGGRISRDRLPSGGNLFLVGLPPGGNLSRGQDKLGHRL